MFPKLTNTYLITQQKQTEKLSKPNLGLVN